ncbi:MAG: hypothetical protein H6R17_3985 [Proteobacteria bacterium]|nr:hypothetical protein [Pseudomonadota bacterium]
MEKMDPQFAKRLALALIVSALVACSWLAPLESSANRYVDAGLKRALVSFATARALNAVISVAQGTEVAVQPAGVGVIFAPGQALDPVNDLIEQFANLMLTASVAFGVQKVLLSIGAHWLISLSLTLTALGWAVLYLRRNAPPDWLSRLLVVSLMIRFALPVVVIGSNLLFEKFMAADYQTSQQGIESVSIQLEKLDPPPATTSEPGLLAKFKDWAASQTDLKTRYAKLKEAAEQATERIVKLMVVFLLQTLVFPIVLLSILWGITRRFFEFPPSRHRRSGLR